MASFAFFDAFTTAQTLADGEFGVIADTGSLRVTAGDAITATGTVAVSVAGTLFGGDSAVDFDTGVLVLNVGESGRINAGADTVAAEDIDRAFVTNDGRIRSGSDALDIRGGGDITIINRGSLIGNSDGIVTSSTLSTTRIVNEGTIVGDDSGGIDHLAGDSFLLNRGTIEGSGYGFDAADEPGATGQDEVANSGSIEGGVFLYAQDDFVRNSGEIDLIELGGGDDVYLGRGKGSAQSVEGGGGRDVLVSSRADDTFAGELAADIFVFARRGGDDRVEDFGGQDRIDLSDFGFSGSSELRPLIEDRPAGALIDLSDEGLTILLENVAKADLRANDFFFDPPVM